MSREASDRLSLGVTILGVSLTDARPPMEVAADFATAQSAESLRDGRINEAKTYEAVHLTGAGARGRAIQDAARTDADRTVLRAHAEAGRFLVLLAELVRSRELTVKRLYVESLQSMLNGVKRKVILPAGDAPDLTVFGLDSGVSRSKNPDAASTDPSHIRPSQNDP